MSYVFRQGMFAAVNVADRLRSAGITRRYHLFCRYRCFAQRNRTMLRSRENPVRDAIASHVLHALSAG